MMPPSEPMMYPRCRVVRWSQTPITAEYDQNGDHKGRTGPTESCVGGLGWCRRVADGVRVVARGHPSDWVSHDCKDAGGCRQRYSRTAGLFPTTTPSTRHLVGLVRVGGAPRMQQAR
jgi:hypothetical protein